MKYLWVVIPQMGSFHQINTLQVMKCWYILKQVPRVIQIMDFNWNTPHHVRIPKSNDNFAQKKRSFKVVNRMKVKDSFPLLPLDREY